MVTTGSNTANPAGSPRVKNTKVVPGPPSGDVAAKQNPSHTEADFARDLGRATRRVEEPSGPDQGSPRR